MDLEQRINYQLNKYPKLKKVIKRIYQKGMYIISKKIKAEGDIIRLSPDDGYEYFFGYYDKSPWSSDGRFVICMKAKNTWTDPDPLDPADIILIDTLCNNKVTTIATTHTWNVQQGCMAQWLGPDFSSKIIYNDIRNGKYCSIILNIKTGEERIIEMPVYTVSADGKRALSLDFSRLHNLRKGYGYAKLPEVTENQALPDSTAVWSIDIESGNIKALLSYKDFTNFQYRHEMEDATHKVNHIMLNPSGSRFMILHRWYKGQRKYSRLVTCNVDGSEMYNLSDDDMVSHCFWKNDKEILAYENKHISGPGYYLMQDKSEKYVHMWPQLNADGHPSFSPDGRYVIMDTYPNAKRLSSLILANPTSGNIKTIGRVFAPFKYDNDTRCDLHPRWSRDGQKICFDGVFEGHRGLYILKLE